MSSYTDQKFLRKQNHIELEDLVRDRALTLPSSTKENIPSVKRRTIFDPPIDIFSPEENTSDYLEDYIEKLGEYHVHRDTRHLHLHTPLQFGANSEKNLALCPIENTTIKEEPKRNKEACVKVESTSIEKAQTATDGVPKTKRMEKEESEQHSNKSSKRSYQLPELKIPSSSKEKENQPFTAPISSSHASNVVTAPTNSKEGPKSLNAIKTLATKKIHVDAPKPIEKGFTIDICPSNDNTIENTPKHQRNANRISPNRNIAKSTRDLSSNHPRDLSRGLSTEEKSPRMTSRILQIPRPQEMDSMAIGADVSKKRMSVAKTSPKPGRKGPKSKSTMHSFFEAFM